MTLIKSTAYATLDAVTFGRGIKRNVGGETIRFPAKFSRYYESDYEPETFAFFRSHVKPGDTVLDIGAHIGLFAVVTGRLVGEGGKVFSFEPTPFTRGVLQQVVDLNGLHDIVEVRGEAVSSKRGKTVFYDTGTDASNANSLVKTFMSKREIPIDLISVDEFVADRSLKVDCIKIDVEGAEQDVLTGAAETLKTMRPAIRLGLHPPAIADKGDSLDAIWELIDGYGYQVSFDRKPVTREWFVGQPHIFDVELTPC